MITNLISFPTYSGVKLKSIIDREIECNGNYGIQFLVEIEKHESMMCNKWFLWFKWIFFKKNSSDKVSVKLNQQLYDKLHKFVVYFIEKWKLLKIEDVEYRKQITITNNKNSQPQINSLSSLLDGSVVRPSTVNSPVTRRSRVFRTVIKWSDADNSLICKWMM